MYKIGYVEIINCIGKFVAALLIDDAVRWYISGGVGAGNDGGVSFCRTPDGIVGAYTTTGSGGSSEFDAVSLSRKVEHKVGVAGNSILGVIKLNVLLHKNIDDSYANGCRALSLKCKI